MQGLLSGLRARNQACDSLLLETGIAPELLRQSGARTTGAQYVSLFWRLIEKTNDEAIGLLSRPLKRGSFALVVRSGMHAQTLGVALRRIAHTFTLLQDDIVLELAQGRPLAGITLAVTPAQTAQSIFLHELLLRVFWRLAAWLAGGRLPPARFDFAVPAPAHTAAYTKVFPAPCRFNCRQSAIWFDASWLNLAVTRDERSARAFLADAPANVVFPRLGDGVFNSRVRTHLQRSVPNWPNLAATATALGSSKSTLQRHLAREGTSFQAVKDELRRDLAILHLTTSHAALTTVSAELGFTDSATFQRAFKNWTGSAPGAYRRDIG